MRNIAFLLLLLLAGPGAWAQGSVLINEVQAIGNGSISDGTDRAHGWVELYNPNDQAVDLHGFRLSIAGRTHVIEGFPELPPKGYHVLWCSGRPERGTDHVGFTLPREGGTLLLIAPGGTSILDVFTWPELDIGISMGRLPDGGREWSFFTRPSPGAANQPPHDGPLRGRTPAPTADTPAGVHPGPIVVALRADADAEVFLTTDGSAPTCGNGLRYEAPLPITASTVLRARACAPGRLPSAELRATHIVGRPLNNTPVMSLAMDPEDLFGGNGIYGPGAKDNHTRGGRAWERQAVVSLPGAPDSMLSVGARISGSGTRTLPKRSFKLYARGEYGSSPEGIPFPDGAHLREGMLRADASPHAFLRNLLVGTLVRRHGLAVDVQPSTPVRLHLNGRYWGLYRWMPAKDAEWLRHISGAGAVDVLEGPAHTVLSGGDGRFHEAIDALAGGAPLDSIGAVIDLGSLLDLACIDLWTGRADHDINVRCYRPREKGGRWRWVLFDMDLWAPAGENSVERVCSAAAPETPYVPQLLAHPEARPRLLARMAALNAVVFAAPSTRRLADSLFHAHEGELAADHRRWELELGTPEPHASLRVMDAFLAERPGHLLRHLSTRTGHALRTVTIEVPPPEQGRLLVEGLALPPGRQEVRCFQGVPMRLEAVPAEGWEFAGWKGAEGNTAEVAIEPSRAGRVRALFRPLVP